MGGKRDCELGCSSFILLAGQGFAESDSCRKSTLVQGGSVQSAAVGGELVPLHDGKWRAASNGKLAVTLETGKPLLIVAGSRRE
jgi:hypothetical protein